MISDNIDRSHEADRSNAFLGRAIHGEATTGSSQPAASPEHEKRLCDVPAALSTKQATQHRASHFSISFGGLVCVPSRTNEQNKRERGLAPALLLAASFPPSLTKLRTPCGGIRRKA